MKHRHTPGCPAGCKKRAHAYPKKTCDPKKCDGHARHCPKRRDGGITFRPRKGKSKPRQIDPNMIDKVLKTICAMANNGRDRTGSIIIGVTDKDSDAARVKTLDRIEPRRVGRRYVVGVRREADALGERTEAYFSRWKTAIRQSALSEPLRGDVLSSIDYNDYYGLGVIVISIPVRTELSFYGDKVYWRDGDETVEAVDPRKVASLARRFG
jgi:predicted HTH transcriptional regulator